MSDEWHQVQDADSPASCRYTGKKPKELKFKEYVHHEGRVIQDRVEPDKKRVHAEHAFTERYILAAGATIYHVSNAEQKVLLSQGILPRDEPAADWQKAGTASKLASVGHAYFALDPDTATKLRPMLNAKNFHIFKTKNEIYCYPDPEIPRALRTDIKIEVVQG